jgi:uncharacterized protein (DUF4415 family)
LPWLETGWNRAGNRLAKWQAPLTGFGQDGGLSETAQEAAAVEDRMRTIAQERAYVDLMIALERQATDLRDAKLRGALIPKEWEKLEDTAPVQPRKKKVTVALDEDVARWFKRLGAGYHGRINAVLRTYMLALISKAVLSQADKDRHGDEIWGRPAPKRRQE